MDQVIAVFMKVGPALIIGFLLGIGVAEWVNAEDPNQPLEPHGYKLIIFLVTLVVTGLWQFVGRPILARLRPTPPAPEDSGAAPADGQDNDLPK